MIGHREEETNFIDLIKELHALCIREIDNPGKRQIKSPKKAKSDFINELNHLSEKGKRVVCVDKKLKYTSGIGMKPKSLVFEGNDDGKKLRLRITECFTPYKDFQNGVVPWSFGCLLEFKVNNSEYQFFVRDGGFYEKIKSILHRLHTDTPLESVELAQHSETRKSIKPFHRSYWTENEIDWDADTRQSHHYEDVSDPMIIAAFTEHVIGMGQTEKPLIIVDVGAGKGRLAMKLLELAQQSTPPVRLHYFMIEPDRYQVEKANNAISELVKNHGEQFVSRVVIFGGTLSDFKKSNHFKELQHHVNVVISSGGPLNAQVVSYRDAIKNLSTMNALLMENGKLIATGLSALLVTRKEFQKHGMNIISAARRTVGDLDGDGMPMIEYQQCYVCEKHGVENKERLTRSTMTLFGGSSVKAAGDESRRDIVEKQDGLAGEISQLKK